MIFTKSRIAEGSEFLLRLGVWAALVGVSSSTALLAQSNAIDPAQSLSARPGWVQGAWDADSPRLRP